MKKEKGNNHACSNHSMPNHSFNSQKIRENHTFSELYLNDTLSIMFN